jgi:hypothetical protein
MYQNDPLKVLTGECRLSYCHLDQPYANKQGAEPKYSVTLLIPKTDTATIAEINSATQAAIAEGVNKTWNGQRPAMPKTPLWDGDGVRQNGEAFGPECKGHWVITASSKQKPHVVHISNIHAELSPADIYSGMYGRVTIRFFTYSNSGNRGVGCGLGNVLKTREGEPLGAGRSDASDDFAGLEQAATSAPAAYPNYAAAPAAPAYGYQPTGYPSAPGAYGINPITGLPF